MNKVLILSWRPFPQGVYLGLILSKLGFNVTYVTNKLPSLFNNIDIKQLSIINVPTPQIFNNVKIHNLINWLIGIGIGAKGYDIVIGIDEQGFVPAALLKLSRRVKILVGYFLEYNSIKSKPSSMATRLTSISGKLCDIIIDVEEHRLKYRKTDMNYKGPSLLIKNVPFYANKIDKIQNYSQKHGDLILLYQGAIIQATCIEQLIRAINNCDLPIKLNLIGSGPSDYLAKIKNLCGNQFNSSRVNYLGFLRRDQIEEYFYKSHVGIVFYHNPNDVNEHYCAPNKLYEYISYGLPIICSNNPSLKFVEEEGIGIQVDPTNIDEICNAIRTIGSNKDELISMQKRCIRLFKEKYNFNKQIGPFINYLLSNYE
jgi:glycosyltransferase involved in cell wall biosynthesis